MFFRTKTSGSRSYLQIVENRWEDGRPRQRVIATLGRLDQLQQSGQLEDLDFILARVDDVTGSFRLADGEVTLAE